MSKLQVAKKEKKKARQIELNRSRGTSKINVGAAFNATMGFAVVGFIARYEHGLVRLSSGEELFQCFFYAE